MTNERCREIEKLIAVRLVDILLFNGYAITVNNGGEENEVTLATNKSIILAAMFEAEEDWLFVNNDTHSAIIHLVYGNDGYDVIADNSVSLNELLQPVSEYSDTFVSERFAELNFSWITADTL